MPLNGGGTASRVPGTSAAPNTTIKSADYEASMDDIYQILNTAPSSRASLATPGLNTANSFTKTQTWAKGADVASASTLTLGDDGNYFDITGTAAITTIASKGVGTVVKLHFDDALTLTHSATDLILPGGANITTAAGDEAEFVEYATGDWRCMGYTYANATASASVTSTTQVQRVGTGFIDTGMEVTITPRKTGKVFVTATFPLNVSNPSPGAYARSRLLNPDNNDTFSLTSVGGSATSYRFPVSLSALVEGLDVGATARLRVQIEGNSAGDTAVAIPSGVGTITAVEIAQ